MPYTSKLEHRRTFTGKGHRKAANEAAEAFKNQGYFVRVRTFNTPTPHVTVEALTQTQVEA